MRFINWESGLLDIHLALRSLEAVNALVLEQLFRLELRETLPMGTST